VSFFFSNHPYNPNPPLVFPRWTPFSSPPNYRTSREGAKSFWSPSVLLCPMQSLSGNFTSFLVTRFTPWVWVLLCRCRSPGRISSCPFDGVEDRAPHLSSSHIARFYRFFFFPQMPSPSPNLRCTCADPLLKGGVRAMAGQAHSTFYKASSHPPL